MNEQTKPVDKTAAVPALEGGPTETEKEILELNEQGDAPDWFVPDDYDASGQLNTWDSERLKRLSLQGNREAGLRSMMLSDDFSGFSEKLNLPGGEYSPGGELRAGKNPNYAGVGLGEKLMVPLGYEIGGNVTLSLFTLPLLRAGWPGWLAYGGINALGGYHLNKKAQTARIGYGDQKEISEGEAGAAAAIASVPWLLPLKWFKQATPAFKVMLGAAEGSIFGGAHDITMQSLQILRGELNEDGSKKSYNVTQTAVSTVFGSAIGGAFTKLAVKLGFHADIPETPYTVLRHAAEEAYKESKHLLKYVKKQPDIASSVVAAAERRVKQTKEQLNLLKKPEEHHIDKAIKEIEGLRKQEVADVPAQVVARLKELETAAAKRVEKERLVTEVGEIADISSLKVSDLKLKLKERGLPISGKKADLVKRLATTVPEEGKPPPLPSVKDLDDPALTNKDIDDILASFLAGEGEKVVAKETGKQTFSGRIISREADTQNLVSLLVKRLEERVASRHGKTRCRNLRLRRAVGEALRTSGRFAKERRPEQAARHG